LAAGQTWFKDNAFALVQAGVQCAIRHGAKWLAAVKLTTEAGCRCVSAGLFLVLSDGAVDGSGGTEEVGRFGGRQRQQRHSLRYRGANGAVGIHSRESVLHRGLWGKSSVVDAEGPKDAKRERRTVDAHLQ
jgi:hypothetical protein